MRLYLVIIGCIVFPSILFAQYDVAKDVVFEDEFKKSFKTRPKLDVKFDNRFSFIQDNALKTVGFKIGLNFRRKFKVGLGLNNMLFSVESSVLNADNEIVPVSLQYSYISPYMLKKKLKIKTLWLQFEFFLFDKKRHD